MDDKEILEALTEDDFDRAKEKSIEDHTEYACTVVSLLPFELNEEKPHMLPSSFIVPAANGDKFGILHVREGVHYIPNPLMDVEKFHRKRLESNRKMQKAWFHNLCIMADADWEKNHDMRAVSDLQRAAAKYLGINKEWVEFRMEEMTKCVYCNSSVSPEASICQNCHQIINRTKYEATKKQFDPSDLFTAKEA